MDPFYTDYVNDYPEDDQYESVSDSGPAEQSPIIDTDSCLYKAVDCAAGLLYDCLDAFGLIPGPRWMDGGP